MRKRNRNFLIIIIIIIIAAAAWYLFFRGDSTDDTTKVNVNVNTEDTGKDSVIDTSTLSDVDIEPDLDDVDYYIDDLTPPDTTIDIDFE